MDDPHFDHRVGYGSYIATQFQFSFVENFNPAWTIRFSYPSPCKLKSFQSLESVRNPKSQDAFKSHHGR
ncbi:MAG TPA: hypothetical protein VGU64_02445 [Terriglobales bacterium]|nr:hypothetical protein [Terriglobales bacterium]